MYNMMDFRESNPGLPIHRLTCYPLGHATPTHPPNLYILTYILNMHNQAKIKTTGYMIRKTSVFSNLHYKLINLNRLGTIDFTVQLSAGESGQVRYISPLVQSSSGELYTSGLVEVLGFQLESSVSDSAGSASSSDASWLGPAVESGLVEAVEGT
jgi:hypothetical protein